METMHLKERVCMWQYNVSVHRTSRRWHANEAPLLVEGYRPNQPLTTTAQVSHRLSLAPPLDNLITLTPPVAWVWLDS